MGHPLETWERDIQRSQRRVDAQRAKERKPDKMTDLIKILVTVGIVVAVLVGLVLLAVDFSANWST